ncbi:phosphoribosyltransferase domain-containing protein [Candidatus Nitrosacidococcus sp. I8]|uniref:phosphoribosyltransferase domain-containing protein n=1 Tax=Candidatus Nitrosacidococcus sp. I8 TaxID=2942908 RepID=UPI002227CD6E|nr:phosphoribosyltransferase domain-containing protein [Candidatus Nitrosacidococcus sp. I8]CAH9018096.1 hypothetical protein NURINAE_00723 [Candidatus Nitrosacidococcus sp. I8]
MSQIIYLAAGVLEIEVHRAELPLDNLLSFASRTNPKRGYLFVSKVLGKHLPCKPSVMRDIYQRLGRFLVAAKKPMVIIGMAETAIGLGAGVAHDLVQNIQHSDIIFQQTTRHQLSAEVWIRFEEAHSHAPGHILYRPLSRFQEQFHYAKTLVLVDDEISTGNTLLALGKQLIKVLPHISQVIIVSIVNWLSDSQKTLFEQLNKPVAFISLLEGRFVFTQNLKFNPKLPCQPKKTQPIIQAQQYTGRRGINFKESKLIECPSPKTNKVSIIGTGEFQFQPFLWAERLEQQGFDVLFQSTTRSPIETGHVIHSKLSFKDEYREGIDHYLYNLPRDRETIIAYESLGLVGNHNLPGIIAGTVWEFS